MSPPRVSVTDLGGAGPLLVLGPSLGTVVETLWSGCLGDLRARFRVLGWDLPGHGASAPASGFTTADLAVGVLAGVDAALGADPGTAPATDPGNEPGPGFAVAGSSLGGAVALEVALAAPDRVRAVVVACSGARIATPQAWAERAGAARAGGLAPDGSITGATPGRWFAPGVLEDPGGLAHRLLREQGGVDAGSYAACCEALASYDLRPRLAGITAPLLAIAGEQDRVTPVAALRHVATGVPDGRLHVLDGVAHQAPAEAPARLAALVADHVAAASGPRPPATSTATVRAEGTRVRREVLGDDHVDRAGAAVGDLTADFQDLITTYAWGGVWTRPGLDRRSRSIAVLTALVARGHHDELAMHLRAALVNGLTRAEIAEVLLQAAVYCGVPEANAAFRVASRVLDEEP